MVFVNDILFCFILAATGSTTLHCPNSGGARTMDRSLLEAATNVESTSLEELALLLHDPDVLLQRTPHENTCLHIASAHGHQRFCEEVVERNQSLLADVNADDETPLLNAVTSGHGSVASFLLQRCREYGLSDAILKQDKDWCNALHHAVSRGYRKLALDLIAAEPALSRAVNIHGESPMFIAVMRDLTDVVEKLLEIPDSAHCGAFRTSVMHAAVRRGNKGQDSCLRTMIIEL
jgi:ankyrin repeat protein